MRITFKNNFFYLFNISSSSKFCWNWCKAIYNKDISQGDFQEQIKGKNTDNFF